MEFTRHQSAKAERLAQIAAELKAVFKVADRSASEEEEEFRALVELREAEAARNAGTLPGHTT